MSAAVAIPDALHVRFLERLAERVVTLQATVAIVETGGARASLERQLHSLAGIAGTYGFHELTDLARRAEHRCGDGAGAEELQRAVSEIAAASGISDPRLRAVAASPSV